MIPNIGQFVYFKGRPIGWLEYLAVKAFIKVNKPDKVYWYGNEKPTGEWGEKILPLVTFEQVELIREYAGVPIPHPAHKSDIVRLQKLIERGGIYLDTNVICRNPFTPLLNNRVVMGQEKVKTDVVGLCNGVMLAQAGENFLIRLLEGFDPKTSLWRGFRSKGREDKYYSEVSIKYSHFLANYWPEEIHVEPVESFLEPVYTEEELAEFFTKPDSGRWEKTYCHKIWAMAREKYIDHMSWEEAQQGESAFAKLVSLVM